MKPSRIVLLLVALLAGGLAGFLFLTSRSDPTIVNTTTTEVVPEARTQILVATQPIGIGERLSPASVQWQDWPQGAVRPEYITIAATPEAITDMTGAIARFEFFVGEPIREQKLVRSDQGYLSAVLDKGMRGVSVAVAANSASGGFIVPNDHVDVVLTSDGATGQTSETILSNVRVLAINTRLGETGSTGAPADPNNPRAEVFADDAIATLELDPSQGETIVNAAARGKLSLMLRSIVDFAPGTDPVAPRAQAIRLIRFGKEASVTAGQPQAGPTDASFDASGIGNPISIGSSPAFTPMAVGPSPAISTTP